MSKKLSPDQRKGQIIQVALQLFKEKGYENTSVECIIRAAGISKGGFYHHYNSKEELLENIAQLFIGEVLAIMGEIAGRGDLSALEKTNAYLRQVNSYKTDKAVEVSALLSELYSGGKNTRLENLIFDYARKQIAPVMKSIIVQGIKEGEFATDYPEEAAEVYVKLFLLHQNEMAEAGAKALQERNKEQQKIILETMKRKYMFLQQMLEDMLGLKKGSLVLVEIANDTMEKLSKKLLGDGCTLTGDKQSS